MSEASTEETIEQRRSRAYAERDRQMNAHRIAGDSPPSQHTDASERRRDIIVGGPQKWRTRSEMTSAQLEEGDRIITEELTRRKQLDKLVDFRKRLASTIGPVEGRELLITLGGPDGGALPLVKGIEYLLTDETPEKKRLENEARVAAALDAEIAEVKAKEAERAKIAKRRARLAADLDDAKSLAAEPQSVRGLVLLAIQSEPDTEKLLFAIANAIASEPKEVHFGDVSPDGILTSGNNGVAHLYATAFRRWRGGK